MTDLFTPIFPESLLLRKYIYCFYLYNPLDEATVHTHYSLPHTYNALSLYGGASISFSAQHIEARGSRTTPPVWVLQGKRPAPLKVIMTGRMKRLTIIFKPLGLNQFIREPLGNIMSENPSIFRLWDAGQFNPNDLRQLENFLLANYQPLLLPQLEQALRQLQTPQAMAEIAAAAGLSLRSFNRLFRTHLGVSPVTHQRISKFRQTLEARLLAEDEKTLTQLTYEHHFYDQSDFIRLYRQLSGSSPQALFRNLQQVGNSSLFFQAG